VGPRRVERANRLLAVFVEASDPKGNVAANLSELGERAGLDARAAVAASSLLRRSGRLTLARRGGLHAMSVYRVLDAAPLAEFATVPSQPAGPKIEKMAARLYGALRASALSDGQYRGTISDLGASLGLSDAQTRVAWRRVKESFPVEVVQEGKRYVPSVIRLLGSTSGDTEGPLTRERGASAVERGVPSAHLVDGGADRSEIMMIGRLTVERLLDYARVEALREAELAGLREELDRAKAALDRANHELDEMRLVASRSAATSNPPVESALPTLTDVDRDRLIGILKGFEIEGVRTH
jgi:hypothetical protein